MITTITATATASNQRQKTPSINLIALYKNYVLSNSKENIYWYMKAIVLIPCLYMVPAITLMHLALPGNYIWFVALCMALFFLNVIVHMIQTKSTVYIPIYHLSTSVIVLLPIISYCIYGL